MPSWMHDIKSSPHRQVLSDTAVGYFFIWIWLLYDLKLCEFLKMIKETITFDNWKWKCYDNYKVWGLMSKKSTSNCEKINSSFQQDPGTAHMYCPIFDKRSHILQMYLCERIVRTGYKTCKGPELLLSLGLMGYFSIYNWYFGFITIPCYRIDSSICSSKECFFFSICDIWFMSFRCLPVSPRCRFPAFPNL